MSQSEVEDDPTCKPPVLSIYSMGGRDDGSEFADARGKTHTHSSSFVMNSGHQAAATVSTSIGSLGSENSDSSGMTKRPLLRIRRFRATNLRIKDVGAHRVPLSEVTPVKTNTPNPKMVAGTTTATPTRSLSTLEPPKPPSEPLVSPRPSQPASEAAGRPILPPFAVPASKRPLLAAQDLPFAAPLARPRLIRTETGPAKGRDHQSWSHPEPRVVPAPAAVARLPSALTPNGGFAVPAKPHLLSHPSPPLGTAVAANQPGHEPSPARFPPPPPPSIPQTARGYTIGSTFYERLEEIGRGGSSKVYRVREANTKRQWAFKRVKFDQYDDACIAMFKGEIELLRKLLKHPRVVHLHDHAISTGVVYLVMELGEKDLAHSLQLRLNSVVGTDHMAYVRFVTLEMLHCVKAVHDADIVHLDLKPANFLWVNGVLKIIDFGIANAVPDYTINVYRDSQIGTPNYMAPEALAESGSDPRHTLAKWRVGKPSDIWSVGCIMYQLIYGKPPYNHYKGPQRVFAITNPAVVIKFPSQGVGGVAVPRAAVQFMQACLVHDPDHRWSVDECMTSEFTCPWVVDRETIQELVHVAMDQGYSHSGTTMPRDYYEQLAEVMIDKIKAMNWN